MIIVLAALQLTSNDVHSEFKRRSARVLRRAAPGAVTFGVATTEGGTMQTMQFNLRALDPAVQVQRPAMQITVTQDTSASTELRSPYSDVESKSLRGSKPDLVGIRSIRIAGSDDELHYI